MSDDFSFDSALADRYLAGECSQEEAERVRAYLDGTARDWRGIATLEQALAHLKARAETSPRVDRGPHIRRLAETDSRSGIATRNHRALPFFRSGARPGRFFRPASLAPVSRGLIASTLLAVAGGLGWYATRHARTDVPIAETSHVYRTTNGQYATVTLPDGSRATLGPATALSVPNTFGGDERSVTLSGAASFTVGQNARTPFVVRAGAASVRVLGTTFVVRRYSSDRAVRVAVTQGRVALRGASIGSDEAILSAFALGIAADSGSITVTSNGATAYAGWTEGVLRFQDTPLREVLADIGRAYDVDIAIRDSALSAQRVTFAIPSRTQSLSQALDDLALLIGARYTRTGRTITITPGRARVLQKLTSPHSMQEHSYGR